MHATNHTYLGTSSLKGWKSGLFVILGNFLAPGSGSVFLIQIQSRRAKLMRIRIRNTAANTSKTSDLSDLILYASPVVLATGLKHVSVSMRVSGGGVQKTKTKCMVLNEGHAFSPSFDLAPPLSSLRPLTSVSWTGDTEED